jgi:hypothetical protein
VKNEAGFRRMLNMPGMRSRLLKDAKTIQALAKSNATYKGASYTTDVMSGAGRAHARVKTANKAAWWNEMRGGGPLRRAF